MELVAKAGKTTVWFDAVDPGRPCRSPFDGRNFIAMLVVNETVAAGRRDNLAAELVAGGCRYAAIAGYDQEAWHGSIDSAAVRSGGFDSDKAVMTTSHGDESLEEVVWFFRLVKLVRARIDSVLTD